MKGSGSLPGGMGGISRARTPVPASGNRRRGYFAVIRHIGDPFRNHRTYTLLTLMKRVPIILENETTIPVEGRIRRGAAVTRRSPQCRRSRPSSSLGAREPTHAQAAMAGLSYRVTRSSTRPSSPRACVVPSSPRACVVPSFPRACVGTFRKHGIMQPKAAAPRSSSPSHARQPPFASEELPT
uniref:Uncharacterized protein n=1 Tax=Candidatus Kentrum sp. SD TaxID=2126332 RepID=A0A450YQP8_9GAMM|nr:MAG: hypothetical protein BECKSD772F_GA0070984_11595 [Candidatus Kentron sp. SD]